MLKTGKNKIFLLMPIFLVVKELTVQGTKMINKDLKISESDNAQGLPTLLSGKEFTKLSGKGEDMGLIPGSGRSPVFNSLQFHGL